jgi:hypothetical protein
MVDVSFRADFSIPEDTARYRITSRFRVEPDVRDGRVSRIRWVQVEDSKRCVVTPRDAWHFFTSCASE